MECYKFTNKFRGKKYFLLIYDISDDKKRTKFAKILEGYGVRVQKSAFEFFLSPMQYHKLKKVIPLYLSEEDNVRIYHLSSDDAVTTWNSTDDIIKCDTIIC